MRKNHRPYATIGFQFKPRLLFAVASLVLLCTMPLAAQDAVLGQLYGNGVHAYFSRDYVKAHELFTQAIDGHTQDPRAYYFRGLDLLKLGRPHEAESDFKQGAKLESSVDPTRVYNVARALERIQGSDRAKLESFRLEARMAVLQKEEKEHAQRYEQTIKEQRDFLQRQSTAPAGVPKPPDVVPPSSAGPPPEEPFDPGKTAEPKPELTTPPPSVEIPAEKPAAPAAGGAKLRTLPRNHLVRNRCPPAPPAGGAQKPGALGESACSWACAGHPRARRG